MRSFLFAAAALSLAFVPTAAPAGIYAPKDLSGVRHADWTKDAVIYQINTRQFTPEGTFRAAEARLPDLKAMGVDILWVMPINPIGVKNRKGPLGSPYSVRDYRAVNPEFGTLADFQHFVRAAHALGMKVIIDWVANHSAWDNALVTQHPDWYERDWKGDFHPTPWWDWSDIIDFNYDREGLRQYMADSMLYWIRTADIDGFRCDVAAYVPRDFWEAVRAEANKIKPVFFLGEAQMRDLHAKAFDATYGWDWYKALESVAQGKADTGALFSYFSENESAWPTGAMRMVYTENHDENAWHGTAREVFGAAQRNVTVLSFVGEGIPLIYNGQEGGNDKRLKFFERDPIEWKESPYRALYTRLAALKTRNPALWNAPWGARMVGVVNDQPQKVFSFVRQKGGDRVFAVFNFSAQPQTVKFTERLADGAYRDFDSGAAVSVDAATRMTLAPWAYRVLTTR
ncbi:MULTISPECIES: alpha-amylase family glycosyl hydrolase [Sphingomonas]|uniref:alpha-amylase family glycosyl hydrolase n=1 Tax=Sphingomonas TaxID=13687 RepID=UPI000DEEC1E4|nr:MULTISPECIES: alpha-amylase family glycosyl hydrolase [Sphingomonas]